MTKTLEEHKDVQVAIKVELTQEEKKKLKEKKKKFFKKIRDKGTSGMAEEYALKISQEWIKKADTNQNGFICNAEFQEFF